MNNPALRLHPEPHKTVKVISRWPEVLTFEEAAEYCGISDMQARRLNLKPVWQRLGIALYIPGERHPRWRRSLLDTWLDSIQEEVA